MSPRILIVEDDAVLADGMSSVLRASGHSVHCLTDGVHANDALAAETYDLAILDLSLPRMDGLGVLRRLRAQQDKIPVLIVTARHAVADRVNGLTAGADDYLTKPFDLAEFEARVDVLIRRIRDEAPRTLQFGALVLDIAGRVLRRDGEPVDLTVREFSVLEALMLHAGEVVSREQLNRMVAVGDEDLADNVFQVHISRIRKKLGPADVNIRTVRGFGYQLQASMPSTARA